MKNGVKFVVKSSGHFRALFPEERGAAKFHHKFHGIFHGNFHARSQETISRQHFCTPRRSEIFSDNRYENKYVKLVLVDESRIQHEHIHVKRLQGIRNVFIPVWMVPVKCSRCLRVLSATFILSKNSRVLDAKSRQKSSNLG